MNSETAGVSGSYELLPEHGDFISFPLVLDYNSKYNDISQTDIKTSRLPHEHFCNKINIINLTVPDIISCSPQ